MADDINELETDANEGEAEGMPEALGFLQGDRRGNNDNRRWRYAVRDVETLDYAGPGIWKQVGPAPLLVGNHQIFQGTGPDSGEVVDIAIDPRPGIIYIATGSGGVWKSTDDGVSWRPITDHLPAISIGAIALDPANPDIVYVGTGNLFDGSRGMPKSAGLFKSPDGGRTWARLSSPVGRPPRPITAAVNVVGGVRVTVAGHGYVTFDRVAAVGLPGMVGARRRGRRDAHRQQPAGDPRREPDRRLRRGRGHALRRAAAAVPERPRRRADGLPGARHAAGGVADRALPVARRRPQLRREPARSTTTAGRSATG